MLCPFCGFYGASDDVVCPSCGKLLPRGENTDTGVMAIRQGKRARDEAGSGRKPIWQERQGSRREYVDPDSRPTNGGQIPLYADPEIFDAEGEPELKIGEVERREGRVYGDTAIRERYTEIGSGQSRRARRAMKKRTTNWLLIAVIAFTVLLVTTVSGLVMITRTGWGRRFLLNHEWDSDSPSSMFYVDAPSDLWTVGEERMNTGDFDGAIKLFERAAAINEASGIEDYNVAGNLLLAKCYEAKNTPELAERIYVRLYEEIAPSNTEAYSNEIRLMLADGREAEAAELMQLAATKTKSGNADTFIRQRNDLLPSQPVAGFTAATYSYRRRLYLTSPEGYEIRYLINDPEAKLPEDGLLYDPAEGIFLDEGTWALRAVCVNGDLVSDELAGVYLIDLPKPLSPNCNLAPGTYEKKQRVRLRPNEENKDDPDITLYYTIDGSIPDADSPIYTGEPIELPVGTTVTLQAVAVNQYGKPSNTFDRTFKIKGKNGPKSAYASDEPNDVGSVKLNSTTYDSFYATYGDSQRYEDVSLNNIGECRRYFYSWGYATFRRTPGAQYLVEISWTTSEIKGPRRTTVGMTMDEVVGTFRDMGQVESPSGNRGLYSNNKGVGKIFKQEDGTYIVRYIAFTADSHNWQLDYDIDSHGRVETIYQAYIP